MPDPGAKLIFLGCIVATALVALLHPAMSERPTHGATVISFSFWGTYEEWNMWREIVGAFEEENPDVSVKLNFIPGNYEDKLRLLLAADSAPDVMLTQDEPFTGFVRYGKFADLTDRVYGSNAPADWKRDFGPTAAESFVCQGRVMGVPLWGGDVLVYYNRRMFREMGVEPPADNWTFDEFVAKARELTRHTSADGRIDTFGFALPDWIYFLPWTWGFGVDYLNGSGDDWAFVGPQAVAATRFYQDLCLRYHVSPSPQQIPADLREAMFMTGRIGMFVGGPWNGLTLKTAGVDFDVVHIPVGPAGTRFTRVTWDGLALSAASTQKEEAWRFMAFCVGYRSQAIVGKHLRSVPALIEAKNAFMKPHNGWNEEKFIEALDYARMQPISVHWDRMRQAMEPVYEKLLLNKLGPEVAVQRMSEEMRRQSVFPLKDGE